MANTMASVGDLIWSHGITPDLYIHLSSRLEFLSTLLLQGPESFPLVLKVAQWTIANVQDSIGYFY
jgi:hypothetical protein